METGAKSNMVDIDDNRVHFQSFVKDDETKKIIESVVSDLMLPDPKFRKGGISDAIRYLSEHRSPRILVVDISGAELPLSDVNALAEVCEPGVTVIAIGDRNDVGLFRDLTQSGVFDYIVKPITATLLQRSLISSADGNIAARQTGRLGKVHTFVGARGGVGTTTLLTSCAQYVAHTLKRRVALVDLDLQYGSVSLSLDLEPTSSLRDAIDDPSRIDSLFLDRAMIKKSETLFVLSSEDSINELVSCDWGAVEALLSQLQSRFHYVFLDIPRHSRLLSDGLVHSSDEIAIISDTSLAGLRDTIRLAEIVTEMGSNCVLHTVVNKIGEHKRGEISLDEFESGIGKKVDFRIPFDSQNVAFATNSGMSIFDCGRSKSLKEIETMAETLVGGRQTMTKKLFANVAFWKR